MTSPQTSTRPLFKVLTSPFTTLQQAFAVCDDCWTWTTVNGETYEDVELVSLSAEEVIIRHAYGMSTISRSELSPEVQQSLIDNSEMDQPEFACGCELDAERSHPATGKRPVRYTVA